MPIVRDQVGVLASEERSGSEHRVGIAAGEELESLPDVLTVDDLRLHFGPDTGMLERLLSGHSIGGKRRIGQRYETNPIGR